MVFFKDGALEVHLSANIHAQIICLSAHTYLK
jgi:hypothetical protein